MSRANYLQPPERHYYRQPQQAGDENPLHGPLSFFSSMNSRGYLFILLVVLYILGVTLFYFSQREQHIEQLAEYHKIQHAQEALNQADLAASRERLNRRRLQLVGKRIQAARVEAQTREEQTAILTARADSIGRLAIKNAVAADTARDSMAGVLVSRAANLAASAMSI